VFGETLIPGQDQVHVSDGSNSLPEPRQESDHDLPIVRGGPVGGKYGVSEMIEIIEDAVGVIRWILSENITT